MKTYTAMDQSDWENMRWTPRSPKAKGPRRLCKFCLFGIILPIVMLCIPLYMRFVYLRPHQFVLSPSDMKLLNYEHRVSTTWCESQTIRMNSTFNAYILPEKPRLQSQRNTVKMERKIVDLEDDMKEYWGFYLLKDSYFRLSVCSRHEGASVVVIKHSKNVARCAWLGELDSAEESDETSNEFDFQQEVIDKRQGVEVNEYEKVMTNLTEVNEDEAIEDIDDIEKILLSERSDELITYLENMEQWSIKSKKMIVNKLLGTILANQKGDTDLAEIQKLSMLLGKTSKANTVTSASKSDKHLQVTKEYMSLDSRITTLNDDEEMNDIGLEETDDDDEDETGHIDHMFNKGTFNQKNQATDKVDYSDEETRSSWSSSEEALAACEGAIFNIPLNGATACNVNATFDNMTSVMTNIGPYIADSTGFYYFIFTNDNEITDNFVAVEFDLHKTVFDVSNHLASCKNSTTCTLDLDFMSHQHLVLEVPQSDSETCEYDTEGETNYHQCNTIVTAESLCEPRGTVYMIFLLLVPVFILVFAYI